MCTGAEIAAATAAVGGSAAGAGAAGTAGLTAAELAALSAASGMGGIAAGTGSGAAAGGLLGSAVPEVIGAGLPGGAAGAMDMFGTAAPSMWNLGIQSAPFSVGAHALETATGIPFNSIGMSGLNKVGATVNSPAFRTAQIGAGMLGDNKQTTTASAPPPQSRGESPSTQELFTNRGIGKQQPMMPPMMGLDPVSLFLLQQRYGMAR